MESLKEETSGLQEDKEVRSHPRTFLYHEFGDR